MILRPGKLYRVNNNDSTTYGWRGTRHTVGTPLIKIYPFWVKNGDVKKPWTQNHLHQGDVFLVVGQERSNSLIYYKIIIWDKSKSELINGFTEGFQYVGQNRHSLWFEEAINPLGI